MTLYGPHEGETFLEHQEHLRLDFVLGSPRRAHLAPLLRCVFVLSLLASALTLALSAAVPTRPGSHGPIDIAAVRAGNGAPSVELEARAGMESRHDRWAEPEGRRGSAAPHNSPASDLPSEAPAATPARTTGLEDERQSRFPVTEEIAGSTPAGAAARPTTILAIIRNAALEFDVDPARLEAVAFCESSLLAEPRVGQAQELGWFQWQPRTWEWLARISGLGYTWRDIVDERAQARLTAWAFANGYASHWSCAR